MSRIGHLRSFADAFAMTFESRLDSESGLARERRSVTKNFLGQDCRALKAAQRHIDFMNRFVHQLNPQDWNQQPLFLCQVAADSSEKRT